MKEFRQRNDMRINWSVKHINGLTKILDSEKITMQIHANLDSNEIASNIGIDAKLKEKG